MADNQGVTESWRPARRANVIDPQVKRMGLVAAGVAAVLALGVGGYTLVSRRPHVIPVIEADSRPLRVKPDNPGGMQIAGAEEQIMGGPGSGKADAMAPAPEVPAPQALRAQVRAAQPAPPPPPAAVEATEQPAPLPTARPAEAAPAVVERAPPAPVAKPMPAVAAKPAVVVKPAVAETGGTQVQLAAMDSEQAAMTEWQLLSKRMPDLLASRHPAVIRAERDGKAIYRLRTGGFADTAAATAFCGQLKAKGAGCAIASF